MTVTTSVFVTSLIDPSTVTVIVDICVVNTVIVVLDGNRIDDDEIADVVDVDKICLLGTIITTSDVKLLKSSVKTEVSVTVFGPLPEVIVIVDNVAVGTKTKTSVVK